MNKFKTLLIAIFAVMLVFSLAACGDQVEKFTVTFDANGGVNPPAAIEEVESGSKITRPTDPGATMTREGYTFDNAWYKDAECTTEWRFGVDTVTSDITLYAGWTEVITANPDDLNQGYFAGYVPGASTYMYLHLYPNGIYYYMGLMQIYAGRYTVVEDVVAFKNVLKEDGVTTDEELSDRNHLFETGIKFVDFNGKQKMLLGYDPETQTLYGDTIWNQPLKWVGVNANSGFYEETGIAISTFVVDGGSDGDILQINHDGTFTDLTRETMVTGTWTETDSGYTLTPSSGDEYTIAWTSDTEATITYASGEPASNSLSLVVEIVEVTEVATFSNDTNDLVLYDDGSCELILIMDKYTHTLATGIWAYNGDVAIYLNGNVIKGIFNRDYSMTFNFQIPNPQGEDKEPWDISVSAAAADWYMQITNAELIETEAVAVFEGSKVNLEFYENGLCAIVDAAGKVYATYFWNADADTYSVTICSDFNKGAFVGADAFDGEGNMSFNLTYGEELTDTVTAAGSEWSKLLSV